jgi:hypothetical protein
LLLSASAAFAVSTGVAVAQDASPQNVQRLNSRIAELEARLQRMERLLTNQNGAAEGQGGRQARSRSAAPARAASASTQTAPTARQEAGAPGSQRAAAEQSEVPQEAFVFRDQAVTLQPGKFDLSVDFNYTRNKSQILEDRSVQGVANIRFGIIEGLEGSVSVPYSWSQRSFTTSPITVNSSTRMAPGDVAAQLSARLWGESAVIPGAIGILGVTAPTGPSAYVVSPTTGVTSRSVPIDIVNFYPSRGHWAFRAGVQFFKTMDPVVFFGGMTVEEVLPDKVDGVTFKPGRRFLYNVGMSFAMSERSTLGISFLGSYASSLIANGIRYSSTRSEQAALRFSLIHRVAESLWLEPSLAVGLVPDSPQFVGGVGIRYRF